MLINDVGNIPVEFNVDGKVYKVKRLSMKNLLGFFEAEVKSERMDNIIQYANKIEDEIKKAKFEQEAQKNIPKEDELRELANEKIKSTEGAIKILYVILSELNDITPEEVLELMSHKENQTALNTIIRYAGETDENEVTEEDVESTEDTTQKKTKQRKKRKKKTLTGATQ